MPGDATRHGAADRTAGPAVLIVEDEPAIVELIAANLEHAGFVPWRAGSAGEALERIRTALPDVVLLDWMLPGESGAALARRLRGEARTREIPIIILTARAEEHDKVAGLEAGADDYLTKPFSPRELIARVKALLRRRAPELGGDAVQVAGLRLEPAARRVIAGGRELGLGPTEFRLLRYLMTHPHRVYSRAQLLDAVWGEHAFIAERTVDVHIRRLRRALSATGHERLIETVRGSGYRLRPPRDPVSPVG